MVEHAHELGVVVAGLVGKKVHAERQKNAGVDIIVAQGYEAGGHTGEISTMVLIPEVVDAVAPTRCSRGGRHRQRSQIAAALALGALGVWCGSVWLTPKRPRPIRCEAEVPRGRIVRHRALARSTGKPARQLRTAWTDAWEDRPTPIPCRMPLHGM